MQLLISAPWWFVPLCLMAGAGYAYMLYKPHLHSGIHKVMAALRFLSISLLAFFLLGPVIIHSNTELLKPKILLVMDHSESVIAGRNGAFYKNEFSKLWLKASERLGDAYEPVFLKLGGDIKPFDSAGFTEKKTNLSQVFDYVNNTFAGQNIGAVVLATDGIYNRGNNPVYKSLNKQIPLYTVGMGDTGIKKDVLIKEANYNAIAYLNNRFPVELNIAADACSGNSTILTLVSEGKTIFSETFRIEQNTFFKTVYADIDADKPGNKHIIATLSPVAGEHSAVNNRKDIFIDIIDGREKILLAFAGPHPDIGAIKQAVGSNRNYELMAMPVQQVNTSDLKGYNVAILHQLPGKGSSSGELIKKLRELKIPIWSISGSQSAIEQLSAISPVAKIDRNQGRFNESQPLLNADFKPFVLNGTFGSIAAELPPLKTPFGIYASEGASDILLSQKIGAVATKTPMWAFTDQNGEKTAFLYGEGLWRWRLYDYTKNGSHEAVDELINKTVQYLAVKEDRRKFRVYPIKNSFDEDEAVKFNAEIYNASYEPINEADVKLVLSNTGGKAYSYTFSKTGKYYQLDMGRLSPGIYTFSATAAGMKESVSGKIIVTPLQTELVNTRADFGLLRQLAKNNSGQFFKAEALEKVFESIKQDKTITSMSVKETRPDELINIQWIFFLLIALIGAEWFIRKYEGGY